MAEGLILRHNQVYLEVWGDYALFTRPEFKVERYSYDTLTPSAARNILQQVYWHPQFQFEINKIFVFNEIRHVSITRNELENAKINSRTALHVMSATLEGEEGKSLSIPHHSPRQQRSSIFLADVHYGILATIKPDKNATTKEFNLKKFTEIFNRRAKQGQSYHDLYLGIKECKARFAIQRFEMPSRSFYEGSTHDLGIMLYDIDYRVRDHEQPIFFHPVMVNGAITLQTQREVMRDAAYCIDELR